VRGIWFDRDGQPIDVAQANELLARENYRRVALTVIRDDVEVSTVWLGLDHNWHDDGPPVIFETMIFGGPLDLECWRYVTEAEAQAGHDEVVALARLDAQAQASDL
jgi:hypothetical protein